MVWKNLDEVSVKIISRFLPDLELTKAMGAGKIVTTFYQPKLEVKAASPVALGRSQLDNRTQL